MIDIHPAVQRTISVVTSVGDDQLGLPTPCADEDVGDLIDHLGVFAVRLSPPPARSPRAEPRGLRHRAVRTSKPAGAIGSRGTSSPWPTLGATRRPGWVPPTPGASRCRLRSSVS